MTPPRQEDLKAAEELGNHIFRWGCSSASLSPENFSIEREKAKKQIATAFQRVREEAFEEVRVMLQKAVEARVKVEANPFDCEYLEDLVKKMIESEKVKGRERAKGAGA